MMRIRSGARRDEMYPGFSYALGGVIIGWHGENEGIGRGACG